MTQPSPNRAPGRYFATISRPVALKGVRGGGGIHQRIADRLSEKAGRSIPADTVKDWVSIARNEFDFLAPVTQGSPRAMAGPSLIDKPRSTKKRKATK